MLLIDVRKGCDIGTCMEISIAEVDLFKEFIRDEFLVN